MWSDTDIVKALLADDQRQTSAALKHLYTHSRLRSVIKQQVRQQSGTEEDAKLVFNEAIVIFVQHVRQQKFQLGKGAIAPYIVSIAKQRYYTTSRSAQRAKAREEGFAAGQAQPPATPEEVFNIHQEKALLTTALAGIGEQCNQLLRHYSLRYSMKEIQALFTYKSIASAKMAVANCRKKLRNYLQKKPKLRAALIEYYHHG